jgi:deferrochelatase/peroxidase EfeB
MTADAREPEEHEQAEKQGESRKSAEPAASAAPGPPAPGPAAPQPSAPAHSGRTAHPGRRALLGWGGAGLALGAATAGGTAAALR